MKNKRLNSEPEIVTTRRRVFIIAIAFLSFCAYLITNLFKLQYVNFAYYEGRVYDQVTTTSALKANRGNIYDSSMRLLAGSKTEWRVFVSTRDIRLAEAASATNYSDLIASGLSEILALDYEKLYSKIKNTRVLDVTIKNGVETREYEKIIEFICKNRLEGLVFTEAQSSRYYPAATMAAHVLGFCGSDNQGLYGLEYYYDDVLSGKDGYYLYAKDANGYTLDTEYSSYFPAEDGYSIVTTIDSYLQTELENQLQAIITNHGVQNRATGIAINTETGAILAMATSSPFDPNDPYTLDELSQKKLDEAGYTKGSAEYKTYKKELLETMWSNKAISETYEPGSTFKIITVATALELGVATMGDRFSCIGYYEVGGWHIKCHKRTGHGSGFTLAYGLQMSCNPTMMKLSERIGATSFYESVQSFGYFEKSGIDLPSEARTIFHELENIGPTELATASFGQRFKVSIINHLTAISAVANGGYLITPYILDKVIDSDGNVVSQHEKDVKRRVISESVASEISKVLEEGVSGDGGAKNARVTGYKVAAKTGTSQKFDVLDENGNSYLRIGSTVAYAPSDGNAIAVIIVVDEPTSQIKYGSYVAAPYVANFLSAALPYLGYEASSEVESMETEKYIGLHIDSAVQKLKSLNLNYEIVGEGEFVIDQTPSVGAVIDPSLAKIILYTEDVEDFINVPSFIGLDAAAANKAAIDIGLNVKLTGNGGSGSVTAQSIPVGALVKRGTVIELNVLICDFEG